VTTDETIQGDRSAPGLVGGANLIVIATGIGGAAGYLITWLVPRATGFADYTVFAIFWGALFFMISALSGIQQEITRATVPRAAGDGRREGQAWRFAVAASVTVLAVMVLTAVFWSEALFSTPGWGLVWPLAVGASSYVVAAVLYGSLYGVKLWKAIAGLMVVEGISRVVVVGAVLAMGGDTVALAWAVVLPIPASIIVGWPYIRARLPGRSRLEVPTRRLLWNTTRTTSASASMGILISGYPAVLGLLSSGADAAAVGLLIVTTTLVRAPLVVVSMALQSYLIMFFRDNSHRVVAAFLRLAALVVAATAVLGVLALAAGPWVFEILFPDEAGPERWLFVALVASSGLVAVLCISGAAVLSRGSHAVYSAGWVAAAVATIACLLLPLDLVDRTVISLTAAPAVGLAVHLLALLVRRPRRSS
jgi:hypothetical protein